MTTNVSDTVIEVRAIIEKNNDLLVLPDAVLHILEMAQKDEISVDTLASTISQDPALTGKLLKIATSSIYGLKIRSGSIHDAVMGLGVTTVKCLALSAAIFDESKFPKDMPIDIRAVYADILAVATTARKIAEICRYKNSDDAFLSGLLHKVGFLFYLQYLPREYMKHVILRNPQQSRLDKEKEVFNLTHAEAGGLIARKWGLMEHLAQAIENHASFGNDDSAKLDDIIRLAVVLNFSDDIHDAYGFEEKITKINFLSNRLGITPGEMDRIVAGSLSDTIQFAEAVEINIGGIDNLLSRANKEIFKTYMSVQKLFKERQSLTKNILVAERERGISDARQMAISTLSHYINNASMVVFGQSQVLRMMISKKQSDGEIVGVLEKSLDSIDESVRKMVAVLDEISELNMVDDVEFFRKSKIINIDERIEERMQLLKSSSLERSFLE